MDARIRPCRRHRRAQGCCWVPVRSRDEGEKPSPVRFVASFGPVPRGFPSDNEGDGPARCWLGYGSNGRARAEKRGTPARVSASRTSVAAIGGFFRSDAISEMTAVNATA